MKLAFYFTAVLLSLFFITSCNKESNPIGEEPPSFWEDIDFRLIDYEPAWSPDGKIIAYVHRDTTSSQTGIWLIDTSRANSRVLYSGARAYSPSWSPDGKWITFSDAGQIFKIKVNGDSLTQLTSEGRNFHPDWSPDGSLILYYRSYAYPELVDVLGIWTLNSSDGGNKRKIIAGEYPAWSPDMRHIYYFGLHLEIYKVQVNDTSKVERLTSINQADTYAAYNRYLRCSRDGNKIAFTSLPRGRYPQIWIMNSDGTNFRQLTSTQGYSCDWSPDGQWIVYTDSRAINGKLWIIKTDGSYNHQLTN